MKDKLRFGMVGGGNRGNIGGSHRRGAQMDNLAVLSAGCFTRDAARNLADGTFWGVEPDRIYSDYREMAERESARPDGIDFVTIVTPNLTHYEMAKCFLEHGIHVVCEKPFTNTVAEAETLLRLADERGLQICVTYTYAHYPIMRECRRLIQSGAIGSVIDIAAAYPQDWMILGLASGEKNYSQWMSDPKHSGDSNATAATGVHLNYLIQAMTGLKLNRVLSVFSYYPKETPLETTARIMMQFEDGTQGYAWTSNVAIGHDCTIELKVFGDKGAIEWSHNDPTHLRVAYLGGPVQILSAARDYLGPESRAASRIPAGHPEGFYEAFGNIYREFCRHLLDQKKGTADDPESYFYPKADAGVDGVRFVRACVRSQHEGNIWVGLDEV